VADIASFKYRAFLSYSHRDVGWARWLHGRLEGFRFDKELIGRETALGPVPKTLRPIFRDREDFSGGHTLTDATVAAMDASVALIVVCSPVAATRPTVAPFFNCPPATRSARWGGHRPPRRNPRGRVESSEKIHDSNEKTCAKDEHRARIGSDGMVGERANATARRGKP
jgi:hypothetical protein